MQLTITDTYMRGTGTRHSAKRTDGGNGWEVTWLPGRVLTRNQAITAMTIADIVATCDMMSDSPMWPFIDSWAGELGMSGPQAVSWSSESPEDALTR